MLKRYDHTLCPVQRTNKCSGVIMGVEDCEMFSDYCVCSYMISSSYL